MKTQDNKYYYSIGNDVYNLIEIEDPRIHGNKYTVDNEGYIKMQPPKWRVHENIVINTFQ
ncbi:hypothetical protein SCORR_v1c05830 [Spiroplasma corruscae]|uniref:Uncharacterized protein n=1 Tax=Spiroplasma corruscae TaxID=216934 RepID=A0A222EPA3_9MOLU|nr:hypothetical protein [Spiroplasma corruscae]ASP28355.1 hypothetical protein SCORR_v1c05830 [Spiroplasma corruscae]